jgi:hypothetical protein
MTTLWVDDPIGTLLDARSAACFFPAPGDGPIERSNALARFVVYGTLAIAAMRGGDRRAVPALAMGAIALLVLAATAKRIHAVPTPDGARAGSAGGHAPAGGPDGAGAAECTAPSADNPFANVLLSEYETGPGRPAACDMNDPAIAQSAEAYYRRGMYQATTDVYNRQASSRQFYTTANSQIPNDQRGFAEALYGGPATHKEQSFN